MSRPTIPPLHEKELLNPVLTRTLTVSLESEQAETLIAEMTARVLGKKFTRFHMEFPIPYEVHMRNFQFRPRMIRLDLNEKTVTCLGWYFTDEGWLIYQVRFLVNRPSGRLVQFEISDSSNYDNPALVPMLF